MAVMVMRMAVMIVSYGIFGMVVIMIMAVPMQLTPTTHKSKLRRCRRLGCRRGSPKSHHRCLGRNWDCRGRNGGPNVNWRHSLGLVRCPTGQRGDCGRFEWVIVQQ